MQTEIFSSLLDVCIPNQLSLNRIRSMRRKLPQCRQCSSFRVSEVDARNFFSSLKLRKPATFARISS